ncbi:hypothetical protein FPV67DRAFT_1682615 [Lyophyllum atratum]|nr:hypothetical protein FPV67DRAFT_1682615 [Lyophyllum atratum]
MNNNQSQGFYSIETNLFIVAPWLAAPGVPTSDADRILPGCVRFVTRAGGPADLVYEGIPLFGPVPNAPAPAPTPTPNDPVLAHNVPADHAPNPAPMAAPNVPGKLFTTHQRNNGEAAYIVRSFRALAAHVLAALAPAPTVAPNAPGKLFNTHQDSNNEATYTAPSFIGQFMYPCDVNQMCKTAPAAPVPAAIPPIRAATLNALLGKLITTHRENNGEAGYISLSFSGMFMFPVSANQMCKTAVSFLQRPYPDPDTLNVKKLRVFCTVHNIGLKRRDLREDIVGKVREWLEDH